MRNPKLLILLLALAGMFLKGCVDIYDQEKYQKPDWLAGKLYTQVAEQENLSQFAECLKILGFDTILDVSGIFTIFAPSDDDIAQAHRVIEAHAEAARQGQGVVVLDGKLIENLHVEAARRSVALAERIAALDAARQSSDA